MGAGWREEGSKNCDFLFFLLAFSRGALFMESRLLIRWMEAKILTLRRKREIAR